MKNMKLIQLYDWGLKGSKINTQYGEITYLEWLEKEKERIESADGRKVEIRNKNNKYALFVNDVSENSINENNRWKEYLSQLDKNRKKESK